MMDISTIDLFNEIEADVKEEIIKNCSDQKFSKDSMVFQKGETANCLYILEEGKINLIIKNDNVTMYSLTKPGEVFGWSSIVDKGVYSASCLCITDIKVKSIKKDKIDDIFNRYPKAAVTIFRHLGSIFSKRMTNAFLNQKK